MDAQEKYRSLRRLCRWFRRQEQKRGLVSTHISISLTNGITLDKKTVAVLEGVVRGDYLLEEFFSAEQLAKFNEVIKGVNQCLLVSDLIDCGIIQTLPPPEPEPEPTDAGYLKVKALLRGQEAGIVPRPDVF